MRKLGILKTALLAAPALLLLANPAAAQPGDHHTDIAQAQADAHDEHDAHEQEETQAPVDPNAIALSLPEPEATWTDHRVQMEAGRRYAIKVESEAFDPVVRLVRAGSTEVLAEDDDSGGGTTPLMIYTPTASGEYVVQIKSFAPGGSGDFALTVEPQAPLPALINSRGRTERGNWQVFAGNLGEGGSVDRGRKYHDYALSLDAGQLAMLHVQAPDDLDTMIQVFTASDRGLTPLMENDDGGGGVNPFLLFAPEEAGTYVVRVIGFDEASAGAYSLRVAKAANPQNEHRHDDTGH